VLVERDRGAEGGAADAARRSVLHGERDRERRLEPLRLPDGGRSDDHGAVCADPVRRGEADEGAGNDGRDRGSTLEKEVSIAFNAHELGESSVTSGRLHSPKRRDSTARRNSRGRL
jgi:hypothetical protein